MTLIRTVLLTSGLVLTVYAGELLAQSSAPDATSSAVGEQAVADTANAGPSRPGPSCSQTRDNGVVCVRHDRIQLQSPAKMHWVMVPAIASLLAQARKAGVFVVYSTANLKVAVGRGSCSGRPHH